MVLMAIPVQVSTTAAAEPNAYVRARSSLLGAVHGEALSRLAIWSDGRPPTFSAR